MLKGFKRREKEFYDKMKEMYNDSLDFSESKYLGSKKPIKVRCMEHGEYITKPCYLVRGSKGCLACSGKFTKDDFIEIFANLENDGIDKESLRPKKAYDILASKSCRTAVMIGINVG